MKFGSPMWMHALWLIPLTALLWVVAARARKRALRRFADQDLLPLLTAPARPLFGALKGLLVTCGTAGLVLALARPLWHEHEVSVARRGREIVFLIDVSRSMLAEDLAPNRLERAKLWIRDLTSSLQGDSVGLVAFAGVPVVKCPLTRDIGFFDMTLDELTPETAPRGGTMIGDAIRKAVGEVFEASADEAKKDAGQVRDIILITDGEDQGSLPVAAAEAAAQAGVRIIALGLGSSSEGALVPSGSQGQDYVTYQGQKVRSKLDADTLAKIAQATPGGVFLNIGTGNVNLDDIYHQLIASAKQAELESRTIVQHDEMFWVFLAAGLLCLFIEPLIEDRGRIAT